jgi:hypothetical protein
MEFAEGEVVVEAEAAIEAFGLGHGYNIIQRAFSIMGLSWPGAG